MCGFFNFKGYLCRHALSVLNYNGVEEIPAQYIVARWRNDFKHTRLLNDSTNSGDVNRKDQWYDRLYRCAAQIVEEGAISLEHYKVALQALEESLNKVCLAEEIESRMTLTPTLQSSVNVHCKDI
ncbi:Far1-related sequence [Thalictrum thalictroides]|uniref:Protein FAR1-RELATED SEQUENCE n=1 Tax=Thalictrum thalictroides TaxID=46969 RepID=A0A7J6WI05_THATH|nr:Far1-related sequence [Thalictrum thalictroides]